MELIEIVDLILGKGDKRARRTMVNKERLLSARRLVLRAVEEDIPGSIVECGTWIGGCLAMMTQALVESKSKKKIYGLDTFTHLPRPSAIDGRHVAGRGHKNDLMSSIEKVRETLQMCELPKSRPKLLKGMFQDTLPKYKKSIGPIAVLRLDGDWYESTKVCLEELYDQVSIGGFIIIDDYGHFKGCRQAVDEFLDSRGIARTELQVTDPTERWWQKKA